MELKNLKKLRVLDLSMNPLVSLPPIKFLQQLERLYLLDVAVVPREVILLPGFVRFKSVSYPGL